MATRPQFCEVTKIDNEDLKSLARRDHLPFEMDERGVYSGLATLLALVFFSWRTAPNGFGAHVAVASSRVRGGSAAIEARLADIAATARERKAGRDALEIFYAVVSLPGGLRAYHVGTAEEIVTKLSLDEQPVDVQIQNLTRHAQVLMIRAERLGEPADFGVFSASAD